MQKGFFQMERYNTTVYHLIFLDFWCIMHLYQIRETRFFGGQFNVSRLHLNLNVVLRTTDAIGLPVDAFIPYFNLVVDGFEHSRKIKAVKKSLCNQNGITYCEINSKDPFAMAAQIKAIFRKNHVYVTSENENDIRFCRNLFFSVKRKNARTS